MKIAISRKLIFARKERGWGIDCRAMCHAYMECLQMKITDNN